MRTDHWHLCVVTVSVLVLSTVVSLRAYVVPKAALASGPFAVGTHAAVSYEAQRGGVVLLGVCAEGENALCTVLAVTGVDDNNNMVIDENVRGITITADEQTALLEQAIGDFQFGDSYTFFMHRREEDVVDVWLQDEPWKVETLIIPKTFHVMEVAASQGALTTVPQDKPRQDGIELVVGEQITLELTTWAEDRKVYLGLCGPTACSEVRVEGMSSQYGIAYTVIDTSPSSQPKITDAGVIVEESGRWGFPDGLTYDYVVYRRTAEIMVVYPKLKPLEVAVIEGTADRVNLQYYAASSAVIPNDGTTTTTYQPTEPEPTTLSTETTTEELPTSTISSSENPTSSEPSSTTAEAPDSSISTASEFPLTSTDSRSTVDPTPTPSDFSSEPTSTDLPSTLDNPTTPQYPSSAPTDSASSELPSTTETPPPFIPTESPTSTASNYSSSSEKPTSVEPIPSSPTTPERPTSSVTSSASETSSSELPPTSQGSTTPPNPPATSSDFSTISENPTSSESSISTSSEFPSSSADLTTPENLSPTASDSSTILPMSSESSISTSDEAPSTLDLTTSENQSHTASDSSTIFPTSTGSSITTADDFSSTTESRTSPEASVPSTAEPLTSRATTSPRVSTTWPITSSLRTVPAESTTELTSAGTTQTHAVTTPHDEPYRFKCPAFSPFKPYLHPHPYNCRKFFSCPFGTKYGIEKICPRGTGFDPVVLVCVWMPNCKKVH